MRKTLLGLLALLLPLTVSAQLISVQPGTGRVKTEKKKKKEKKEPKKVERIATPQVADVDSVVVTIVDDDNKVKATVDADILTRYYWRGQEKCGLTVQPEVRLNWRGLSLSMEGSTGLHNDDHQEIDLGLSYQLGPVNIGVFDYWQTGLDQEDRYFYYNAKKGGHQFEGNIGFTCSYFSLQGYCVFGGRDYKINGNRAYSTYVELTVPFRLGSLDWQMTAGMTPMESAGQWNTVTRETVLGEREVIIRDYDYADGPACCSATLRCTKNLKAGTVRLPVFAEINTNPYLKKANLLFGLSIIPW